MNLDWRDTVRPTLENPLSPLASAIGAKGYHDGKFVEGPYPVHPH